MNAFPEGNTARSTDNELRSLMKWADLLYQSVGNTNNVPYPEGTQPFSTDNEERLETKINGMLSP